MQALFLKKYPLFDQKPVEKNPTPKALRCRDERKKEREDFFGISNVHGSFTDISDLGSPMGDVAPLS